MARAVMAHAAEVHVGTTFVFAGRPLVVTRVYGDGPAAPVIVEELTEGYAWLRGQYAMWSADGVMRAMTRTGVA